MSTLGITIHVLLVGSFACVAVLVLLLILLLTTPIDGDE